MVCRRCTISRDSPSSANSGVTSLGMATETSPSVPTQNSGIFNSSTLSANASVFTLSSSRIWGVNLINPSLSRAEFTFTIACAKGWRTLTFAWLRAALPRLQTLIANCVSAERSRLILLWSATGKSARCTLNGAVLSIERTRFWYTSSAMNGVKGAINFETVTRQWYSVL